jgi:hypothetical protein
MTNFKTTAALVVCMVTVTACGGGNSGTNNALSPSVPTQTPKEQVAALEASGAIPNLDRSVSPNGVDVNLNGVRDDIEAFLLTNYPSTIERVAATQFASAVQAAVSVNKADTEAVKTISIRMSRAVNCIYSKFGAKGSTKRPAAVVDEVRSLSTNTKTRLLAYLAYSKALDGTSTSLPEGDTCE